MGHIVTEVRRRWPGGIVYFDLDGEFEKGEHPDFIVKQSVGEGGRNLSDDVLAVKKRLNSFPPDQGGPSPRLDETGKIDGATITAIHKFQKHRFGWSDGRVDRNGPTIIELTIGAADDTSGEAKGVLINAVHQWNRDVRDRGLKVKWVRRISRNADYVVFRPGGSNESVGRPGVPASGFGRFGGVQYVNISVDKAKNLATQFGGTSEGVVIHEMGHAAGLLHEHQRSDRDDHVTIKWGNIVPGSDDPNEGGPCCAYVKAPTGQDPNCKHTCPRLPPSVPFGCYDFRSTMHYFSKQKSDNGMAVIKGQEPMGSFSGLSLGDIAALNFLAG